MFRPMRRAHQQLPKEETELIVRSATSGVLALMGDDGYPYTVPLSHVYHNGTLYFHGAKDGHKADAVRRYDKASFCVVASDDVIPSRFTTHYKSVIAFGRVREVTDAKEKAEATMALAMRFGMHHMDRGREEIAEVGDRLFMVALDVEHMTGKESLELWESRKKG